MLHPNLFLPRGKGKRFPATRQGQGLLTRLRALRAHLFPGRLPGSLQARRGEAPSGSADAKPWRSDAYESHQVFTAHQGFCFPKQQLSKAPCLGTKKKKPTPAPPEHLPLTLPNGACAN